MTNSLQDKLKFDALGNLIRLRGSSELKNTSSSNKFEDSTMASVWEKKPIDFSPRLYQPKPPKRNSREAMKPWKFGSRSVEVLASSDETPKKPLMGLEEYLSDKTKPNLDLFDTDPRPSFTSSFRILTANRARFEASKTMGFREGLDSYKGLRPHDFRGVSFFV